MFNKSINEAGTILYADPGADRPLMEVATIQCVHCGKHWIPQRGSGNVRGFCMNCNGYVCGPDCKECVPVELMLENIEKGRDLLYRPIIG